MRCSNRPMEGSAPTSPSPTNAQLEGKHLRGREDLAQAEERRLAALASRLADQQEELAREGAAQRAQRAELEQRQRRIEAEAASAAAAAATAEAAHQAAAQEAAAELAALEERRAAAEAAERASASVAGKAAARERRAQAAEEGLSQLQVRGGAGWVVLSAGGVISCRHELGRSQAPCRAWCIHRARQRPVATLALQGGLHSQSRPKKGGV